MFFQIGLLMLMPFASSNKSIGHLRCTVDNGRINLMLTLPYSKHIIDDGLYFRATEKSSNKITNYTNCSTVKTNEITVECLMWKTDYIHHGEFVQDYALQVINMTNNHVIWNYLRNNYNPSKNFFDCFPDHAVKILRYAGGKIQWRTNSWDDDYNFIRYFRITVGERLVIGKLLGKDCRKTCEHAINGIDPCKKYNVCIETKYRSNKVFEPVCKHIMPEKTCTKEESNRNLVYLLPVLGVLLILSIITITVYLRQRNLNRGTQKQKCKREIDEVLVGPREDLIEPKYEEIPDLPINNMSEDMSNATVQTMCREESDITYNNEKDYIDFIDK